MAKKNTPNSDEKSNFLMRSINWISGFKVLPVVLRSLAALAYFWMYPVGVSLLFAVALTNVMIMLGGALIRSMVSVLTGRKGSSISPKPKTSSSFGKDSDPSYVYPKTPTNSFSPAKNGDDNTVAPSGKSLNERLSEARSVTDLDAYIARPDCSIEVALFAAVLAKNSEALQKVLNLNKTSAVFETKNDDSLLMHAFEQLSSTIVEADDASINISKAIDCIRVLINDPRADAGLMIVKLWNNVAKLHLDYYNVNSRKVIDVKAFLSEVSELPVTSLALTLNTYTDYYSGPRHFAAFMSKSDSLKTRMLAAEIFEAEIREASKIIIEHKAMSGFDDKLEEKAHAQYALVMRDKERNWEQRFVDAGGIPAIKLSIRRQLIVELLKEAEEFLAEASKKGNTAEIAFQQSVIDFINTNRAALDSADLYSGNVLNNQYRSVLERATVLFTRRGNFDGVYHSAWRAICPYYNTRFDRYSNGFEHYNNLFTLPFDQADESDTTYRFQKRACIYWLIASDEALSPGGGQGFYFQALWAIRRENAHPDALFNTGRPNDLNDVITQSDVLPCHRGHFNRASFMITAASETYPMSRPLDQDIALAAYQLLVQTMLAPLATDELKLAKAKALYEFLEPMMTSNQPLERIRDRRRVLDMTADELAQHEVERHAFLQAFLGTSRPTLAIFKQAVLAMDPNSFIQNVNDEVHFDTFMCTLGAKYLIPLLNNNFIAPLMARQTQDDVPVVMVKPLETTSFPALLTQFAMVPVAIRESRAKSKLISNLLKNAYAHLSIEQLDPILAVVSTYVAEKSQVICTEDTDSNLKTQLDNFFDWVEDTDSSDEDVLAAREFLGANPVHTQAQKLRA